MNVVVVDYGGGGNLHSMVKALARAAGALGQGHVVRAATAADEVAAADWIVLPGQGAFADCRGAVDARAGMMEALAAPVVLLGLAPVAATILPRALESGIRRSSFPALLLLWLVPALVIAAASLWMARRRGWWIPAAVAASGMAFGVIFVKTAAAPLLDGHNDARERVSDPGKGFIRAIAAHVEELGRLGQELTASDIYELAEENDIAVPGLKHWHEDAGKRQVGKVFSRSLNGASELEIEDYCVTLGSKEVWRPQHSDHRALKCYTFHQLGAEINVPADAPEDDDLLPF